MTYRLVLLEEDGVEEDCSSFHDRMSISVEPPLTDDQVEAIRLMSGRANSCDATGAETRKVSPIRIEIASYCDLCRDDLIKKIVNLLGKKITILVD
jgi:hypothetical protein